MFIRYVDEDQEMYRKAVTAYTSNIPIYVNGSDINQSSYPAINYRPSSDRPYYSYVPIASFSNIGAVVNYDSVSNVINVTTDYFNLTNQIKNLKYVISFINNKLITGITDSDIEEIIKYKLFKFGIGEVSSIDNVTTMHVDGFKVELNDSSITSNFSVGDKVIYFLVTPNVPEPHGPFSMGGFSFAFHAKATNGKWYIGVASD